MEFAAMVFWGGFMCLFIVALVLRRLDQDTNLARLERSHLSAQDAAPETHQRAPSMVTWDRIRSLGAWVTELKAPAIRSRSQSSPMRGIGGLIPICAHCNTFQDDRGRCIDVPIGVDTKGDEQFTHGICPKCLPVLRSSL